MHKHSKQLHADLIGAAQELTRLADLVWQLSYDGATDDQLALLQKQGQVARDAITAVHGADSTLPALVDGVEDDLRDERNATARTFDPVAWSLGAPTTPTWND